ncbi:hypothetical protein Adi01nite_04510 [Amorphoplanes digitatis]|nr:hypothetical protein Adi01nite_04510 [Actinoplanes digitatis]
MFPVVGVLVLALAGGCASGTWPSSGDAGSGGSDAGRGGELVLPDDAPPRLRRAFEKATSAEEKRDEVQQQTLDIVDAYSPPPAAPVDFGQTADAGEPPADAEVVRPEPGEPTTTPGVVVVEPPAPGDTYRPAPGGPQRAVPAATVPPEVREAIANWVEAQRRRQRACAQIGKELDEAQRRSGTGRSVSAVCSVDDIPAEFLPWLRRLGYDEGELSGRGQ